MKANGFEFVGNHALGNIDTHNSIRDGNARFYGQEFVNMAQALNDQAVERYPKNTLVNEANLPLIRAALEL